MVLRGRSESLKTRNIAPVAAVAALLCGLGYVLAQQSAAAPDSAISSAQHASRDGGDALSVSLGAGPAGPRISSVQSASASSWGSDAVSVSLHSSVAAGDLLVADVATRGGSTAITAPSGWSAAGRPVTYPGTIDTGIFYRVVGAAQPSVSFTLSSSQAWVVTLREWKSSTGWQTAPLDVTAGTATGNAAGLNSGTTGTTAQSTELVVAALGWNSAGQSESGLTTGFTPGALGSAGGTISVREAYRVTGAPGRFDARESLSAAEWNASTIAAFRPVQGVTGRNQGKPSPSPGPSRTAPGPGPTTPPRPGPTAIGCASQLTGSNEISVGNGLYHLQSDEWDSGAPFTVCNDGNADFEVSSTSIGNSTSGPPGAYPSLYRGCHWGDCTASSGLPVRVSAMTGGGVVSTSYATTTTGSGSYDDAYDIWFNQASSTGNNSANGLEMMIWLNHNGAVQPAGSKVASGVPIGGRMYDVWHAGNSPGGTVSYVLDNPVASVSNLDLGPLAADAAARGYMSSAWFLIDVEAGFEIWQGGQGLAADSFSLSAR
jgi:hypothetical protein